MRTYLRLKEAFQEKKYQDTKKPIKVLSKKKEVEKQESSHPDEFHKFSEPRDRLISIGLV